LGVRARPPADALVEAVLDLFGRGGMFTDPHWGAGCVSIARVMQLTARPRTVARLLQCPGWGMSESRHDDHRTAPTCCKAADVASDAP
jgi:hypothetical protein